MFLGYPKGVKDYRIRNRSEPGFRVTISREVVFNEDEFPCLKTALDLSPISVDSEPLSEVESTNTLTEVESSNELQVRWSTFGIQIL